jgi:hypothetical protein
VADRDLREADVAGELRPAARARVAVGVHEHDRDGADAVVEGLPQPARARRDRAALDRAVGAHALVDLDDALVEHLRLDDLRWRRCRPRLIADLERVAEAARDHQQRAVALALEQRVGGDRGAHLDRADAVGGIGSPAPGRAGRGCPAWRRRDRPPGSPTGACGRDRRRACAPRRR